VANGVSGSFRVAIHIYHAFAVGIGWRPPPPPPLPPEAWSAGPKIACDATIRFSREDTSFYCLQSVFINRSRPRWVELGRNYHLSVF
jgi:hypothetical protein